MAADPITCPSCLHSANDCFMPRQDILVCCNSDADPWMYWNDVSRACHDSTATVDVAYPAYTTCESACSRADTPYNQGDYYNECKDPANGEQTAAMKDAAPDTDAKANKKTWCTCVEACLTCTGGAGGIGERPKGLINMNSDFTAIHGTCVPTPASWETLTAAPAPSPTDPLPSPTATNFICAATDPVGTYSFISFHHLSPTCDACAARNLTRGVRVCCVCVRVCLIRGVCCTSEDSWLVLQACVRGLSCQGNAARVRRRHRQNCQVPYHNLYLACHGRMQLWRF